MKFTDEHVSDQKRVARGEHLLYALHRLQARDGVHHSRWRVMMLAGGSPSGEIGAIRELMPRSHITAIDKDSRCLDAAIEAGVDEIIECDLANFTRSGTVMLPCAELASLERFDLVDLDLCSNANVNTRNIARAYSKGFVAPGGVMIFNFSYGRDVVPMFQQAWWRLQAQARVRRTVRTENNDSLAVERLADLAGKTSESLAYRCAYLFSSRMINKCHSVILYQGNAMPMCSLLFVFGGVNEIRDLSIIKLDDHDFTLEVTQQPDPAKLFDCPQARIESLRRRNAALKAALTRRLNAERSHLSHVEN